METQAHFKELLRLLEKHKAEYAIVGGYAVAFHGYPRFTKDIDIFFRNSKSNIDKIRRALIEFGFPEDDLKEALFVEPGNIIQFGVSPLRVDIINAIDGVSFDEVIANSVRGKYGEIEVSFIGRQDSHPFPVWWPRYAPTQNPVDPHFFQPESSSNWKSTILRQLSPII